MTRRYRTTVGTSTNGNIEKNCHVYHICQHLEFGLECFAEGWFVKMRQQIFFSNCRSFGVIVIQSIVMDNHTHDIVWVESYEDIAAVYQATNTALSRLIRKRLATKLDGKRLFSSRPRYTAIRSLSQFYAESLYLFTNPGKGVHGGDGFGSLYSSFALLKNGFIPEAFDVTIYEKKFGLSLDKYLSLLEEPINEYNYVISRIVSRFPKWKEDSIFKIDPQKPYRDGS